MTTGKILNLFFFFTMARKACGGVDSGVQTQHRVSNKPISYSYQDHTLHYTTLLLHIKVTLSELGNINLTLGGVL